MARSTNKARCCSATSSPATGTRSAAPPPSATAVSVADPTVNPPASFYTGQPKLPEGGFGYIMTRDGTTLSANVVLPGPCRSGPVPDRRRVQRLSAERPRQRPTCPALHGHGLRLRRREHARHRLQRRVVSLLRDRAEPRRLRRDRDRRRPAVGARQQGRHGRHLVSRDHPTVRRRDPTAEPRRRSRRCR